MTLHLTRDEAARLDADGRVVLFRAGDISAPSLDDKSTWRDIPPAEFVEAAKACPCACHRGFMASVSCLECGCLDGKRRIAVAVPCVFPLHGEPHLRRPTKHTPCGCFNGLVTVATVVVEWGPLVVVGTMKDTAALAANRQPHLWADRFGVVLVLHSPRGMVERPLPLPPDIDPQSLLGQYAFGIKAAS